MERAIGIGGVFMRAKDPQALARWYRDQLGIDTYSEEADGTWWQEAGPTVWAPFPTDTDYFGRRDQGWMINVRVRDLDAMLAQLRANGATIPEGPGDGRHRPVRLGRGPGRQPGRAVAAGIGGVARPGIRPRIGLNGIAQVF